MELLTLGNPKTAKGESAGYLTGVLHLAPYTLAGGGKNVCPYASRDCVAACLNTAGRGGIIKHGERTNAIQEARKRKTREFFADRKAFGALLEKEIAALSRKAKRDGLRPAVRLNGTSDLDFHAIYPALMPAFPRVQFYDYTKNPRKALDYVNGKLPRNYHVTFSRSETNETDTADVLKAGGNVAIVFSTKRGAALPAVWKFSIPVVDGDSSDLRFKDPLGVVVGLRAKGKARNVSSGFVVSV